MTETVIPERHEQVDEQCPRCDEDLYLVDPNHAVLSCGDCDFEKHPTDTELTGITDRIFAVLWPQTRTLAVSILAFSIVLPYLLSDQYWVTVLGGFVAVLLWTASPDQSCSECAAVVGNIDGFCWNCGAATDDTVSIVDPDAQGYLELFVSGFVEVVEYYLPDWIRFEGIHVRISMWRVQCAAERIVEGRRELWRWLFNAGILLMLLMWAGIILWAITFGGDVLSALSAGASGSAGGASGSDSSLQFLQVGAWVGIIAILLTVHVWLHELGHAISGVVDGQQILRNDIYLLGPIASFGVCRIGNIENPIADMRCCAAGQLLVLISAAPAMAFRLAYPDISVSLFGSPAEMAMAIAMLHSLAAIGGMINWAPYSNSDGGQFLDAIIRWVQSDESATASVSQEVAD